MKWDEIIEWKNKFVAATEADPTWHEWFRACGVGFSREKDEYRLHIYVKDQAAMDKAFFLIHKIGYVEQAGAWEIAPIGDILPL